MYDTDERNGIPDIMIIAALIVPLLGLQVTLLSLQNNAEPLRKEKILPCLAIRYVSVSTHRTLLYKPPVIPAMTTGTNVTVKVGSLVKASSLTCKQTFWKLR